MRDYFMLAMTAILFPLAFGNRYIAYLLWGWSGIAAISAYLFGFMQSVPLSLIFAVATLVHIFLGKDEHSQKFKLDRTSGLYILFSFQIVLTASLAYEGHARNWELASNMLKTMLFCILMPLLVTSRFRLHVMVIMVAIATGYHGLLDGLKFLASGGNHLARGIQKFGDNNHFAMILNMVLPLIFYGFRYSANRIVRAGFLGLIPLVILAIVATHSRGGLACLVAVGLWFVLAGRHKVAGMFGVMLSVILVIQFAPESWSQRMNTIGSAGEDASFMGRVGAWQVGSAIALAHPLVGGGFHSVEIGKVWDTYKNAPSLFSMSGIVAPTSVGENHGRASHSIYFEVMGDMGFLGLLTFLAIMINAFLTARQIAALTKTAGPRLEWARLLSEMLTISLLAFMAGGALLSAAYFELPYYIFMMIQVLKLLVVKELGRSAKVTSALRANGS